jgi:23S rRNA pseudouridine2605 synthase
MHPSSEIEKTYLVIVEESVKENDIRKLGTGVHLTDGKTAPARVEIVPSSKNREILITIHEGKNKQVRRMFESLGYEIEKLQRLHYAGITARGLKRGSWRFLAPEEISHLKKLAGLLSDEAPRKVRKRRRE